MKKELDGRWIPLREGIREHLGKMTASEGVLFIYYLLDVDHYTWIGGKSISYLAKGLGWGEQRVVDAKDGLVKKGYIGKRGQTNIRIPKFKKFVKQVEGEVPAYFLASKSAFLKFANTTKTVVNTTKTVVNTTKTVGNTRERDKQTKHSRKPLLAKSKTSKRLARYLTERNQGRNMVNYSINYLKKHGENNVKRGLDAVDRAAYPSLKLFHDEVKRILPGRQERRKENR